MIATGVLALRCQKATDRVNACIDNIVTKIEKFITLDCDEIMVWDTQEFRMMTGMLRDHITAKLLQSDVYYYLH